MGSYQLGDADRERLGAPEWLPLDLLDATLDDVTALAERFGFELDDWPDVFFGPVDMSTVGQEGVEPSRKPPRWAIKAALWLALRKAGVEVAFDDIGKIALLRVKFRSDEEPPKGDAATSDPDESSTIPPSSTSSPD